MTKMDDLAETLRIETAAINRLIEPPIRVVTDPKWPLIIVISGGQTGADQAGLRAARACGYRTGGMAPKGWRTDDGPAPWLKDYGLTEGVHHSYAPRTEWNVRNSSGTIWCGVPDSPGAWVTFEAIVRYERPHLTVPVHPTLDTPLEWADEIRQWIINHQIVTLNVAGNRERTNPGIGARTEVILREAINRLSPLTGGTHAT